MPTREFNVLFLCTGNSARSIMAEALLNRFGQGRFRAFSAGSHPTGQVHQLALWLLQKRGIPTDGLRSKGWEEFGAPAAPVMDLIITVCDNAAGEICPLWPGRPVTAHWGIQDPAAVEGTEGERLRAFERAASELETRIYQLTALHLDESDPRDLKQRLDQIGRGGNEEKP